MTMVVSMVLVETVVSAVAKTVPLIPGNSRTTPSNVDMVKGRLVIGYRLVNMIATRAEKAESTVESEDHFKVAEVVRVATRERALVAFSSLLDDGTRSDCAVDSKAISLETSLESLY